MKFTLYHMKQYLSAIEIHLVKPLYSATVFQLMALLCITRRFLASLNGECLSFLPSIIQEPHGFVTEWRFMAVVGQVHLLQSVICGLGNNHRVCPLQLIDLCTAYFGPSKRILNKKQYQFLHIVT